MNILSNTIFYFCLLALSFDINSCFSQCSTISNLSFYTSAINSCQKPQIVYCYPQYQIDQTPILIKAKTVTFNSKQDVDFSMDKNGCTYFLKVSGSYTPWGNSNEYFDGYGRFNNASNNLIQQESTFQDLLSLKPDSGPTAYNTSHEYYFYFTGNATNFNFTFTDSPYNDNSGSMTLEWYVIPCFSYLWNFGGGKQSTDSVGIDTLTNAGTYQITFTVYDEANKCDDSYTVPVTISGPSINNISEQICSGSSYIVGNNTYTKSGSYIDTLLTPGGCDSIINLTLTLLSPYLTYIDTSICSNKSFTVGNNIYSNAGNYIDTLITADGCDSIVNLNLSFLNPDYTYIDTVLCSGTSITIENSTYNKSGNYVDTLQTINGCDSIIDLTLTISPPIENFISATICNGS